MQSETNLAPGVEQLSSSDAGSSKDPSGHDPVHTPGWLTFVPFFSSAFFFLSTFCALFAPLPVLFLFLRKGRTWAWLAALANALIVGLLSGWVSSAIYVVFVGALSLTLPELLNRQKSIEKAVGFTLLVIATLAGGSLLGYALIHQVNPIQEIHQQMNLVVDYAVKSLSAHSTWMNSADLDERKNSILAEIPSAIAIFSLVMVWANLILLLRVNPNRIRESLGLDASYFKKWKAPEFLVWPAIVSGAFLVYQVPVVSDVALNFFNFIMTIYVFQGLCILSFVMDQIGVRGIFRTISYVLAAGLAMPLLLALGFFDLWFDFRSKLPYSGK